ncbi:MAG: hypothetical protein BM485_17825 [Desulfobulbaceae bacterium DB1]|nr:MAG: hypothetical protein BM485_17825 [Desulfobulbaceae bacterium DB1]
MEPLFLLSARPVILFGRKHFPPLPPPNQSSADNNNFSFTPKKYLLARKNCILSADTPILLGFFFGFFVKNFFWGGENSPHPGPLPEGEGDFEGGPVPEGEGDFEGGPVPEGEGEFRGKARARGRGRISREGPCPRGEGDSQLETLAEGEGREFLPDESHNITVWR